jgi:hypothetical protein
MNWFDYISFRLKGPAFHRDFLDGKVDFSSPDVLDVRRKSFSSSALRCLSFVEPIKSNLNCLGLKIMSKYEEIIPFFPTNFNVSLRESFSQFTNGTVVMYLFDNYFPTHCEYPPPMNISFFFKFSILAVSQLPSENLKRPS